MTIRSHSATITVPKFTLTFQLHLQDQALLNLYIRMSTRVSRVQVQVQVQVQVSRLRVIKLKAAKLLVLISMWLTLVVNKYFAVIQCAHAWQIKNLAETNFVEIFGRAKQILSVQCVRTHNLLQFNLTFSIGTSPLFIHIGTRGCGATWRFYRWMCPHWSEEKVTRRHFVLF